MGIPDHLTCLPRYLYAGKEVTIRTRHGTMDRFEIGKGVCKGVYCHLAYLTYMQILNARLDKAKAGIKNSRRNINNLRYGDDTTLMAESEEEPLDESERGESESEKAGLKVNIQKTKIIASSPITSWQIDGETMETVTDFILVGAPKSLQMVTSAMKLKDTYSLEEKL